MLTNSSETSETVTPSSKRVSSEATDQYFSSKKICVTSISGQIEMEAIQGKRKDID